MLLIYLASQSTPPLLLWAAGTEESPAPGGIRSIFGVSGYGVIGSSVVRGRIHAG